MLFLTADQVQILAAAAEAQGRGAGTLVVFLSYTGLRWGEVVALRRSSLDLLRYRVHVRRSASEVGGRLIESDTKNHECRTVVLPRAVSDLVASHLQPGSR